jgi:hypothetical protein
MEITERETTPRLVKQLDVNTDTGSNRDHLTRWHMVYALLKEIAATPCPDSDSSDSRSESMETASEQCPNSKDQNWVLT